ncbi:ATP-dependent DNA helicase [soil metagenome]
MSTPSELIDQAFDNLAKMRGFAERPDQRQLALLLSDLIEQKSTGAFEAPTGLGKSLAALIPAIAHAIASEKRTIIATYTNVLAEQYWRSDLPLAMSLFEGVDIRTAILMGRQRYTCLAAMGEHAPAELPSYRQQAKLGNESEFRSLIGRPSRELTQLWQKVATPPVCPGRFCPEYDGCYYYSARRGAEKAHVVITNHSVVVQHALMMKGDEGQGLLGNYDFLILDEAHDFPSAATNGLEFELSLGKLASLGTMSTRLETALMPLADAANEEAEWIRGCTRFREGVERCQTSLMTYGLELGRTGILTATPNDVLEHPQVKANQADEGMLGAQRVANQVSFLCNAFSKGVKDRMQRWKEAAPTNARQASEQSQNYLTYITDFGLGASFIFEPQGVAVSYAGRSGQDPILRQDVIGLAEPLRELLWNKGSYACLSATLALDGTFDFFRRSTGVEPDFEEMLPSPFDFVHQAAIYLPAEGAIPDPTLARRNGTESEYFQAVASELSAIIMACQGRTLALFHSRREMEGVLQYMNVSPDLQIYTQLKSGGSYIGERFVKNIHSSLFALRSFWTGFDAPGETLSCVALVRVPFEVPTDPPQIARMAYLQTLGLDAFREHTLPMAKMIMRQGAGRLIRRAEDKGIIALLDPRLQTKNYGEEILENLPAGMRRYRDIGDAVGWIGLT